MKEGARRKRALFRLRRRLALGIWLSPILWVLAALYPAQAAPQCGADHVDRHVRVRYVYDGDTVTLQDGQRLRLIGLDAPERGRDGKPDQPFALAARDAVRALLKGQPQLELRLDRTHHDHYGRLLAHVFLADGTSLSAWLLEHGYATLLIMPPDVWNAGCYAAAERRARTANRGIWALPQYRPIASTALQRTAHGYHLIKGRVIHVGNSRHSLWLDLEGKVAARIDRKDLGYFRGMDLSGLLHKQVIVRGWVHPHRDELQLRLRYAADLEPVAP